MWKISPFPLQVASRALPDKMLPGKDSSILRFFVTRSGLKIQAELLHHHGLMTFSKYKCFEPLRFQKQEEQ